MLSCCHIGFDNIGLRKVPLNLTSAILINLVHTVVWVSFIYLRISSGYPARVSKESFDLHLSNAAPLQSCNLESQKDCHRHPRALLARYHRLVHLLSVYFLISTIAYLDRTCHQVRLRQAQCGLSYLRPVKSKIYHTPRSAFSAHSCLTLCFLFLCSPVSSAGDILGKSIARGGSYTRR